MVISFEQRFQITRKPARLLIAETDSRKLHLASKLYCPKVNVSTIFMTFTGHQTVHRSGENEGHTNTILPCFLCWFYASLHGIVVVIKQFSYTPCPYCVPIFNPLKSSKKMPSLLPRKGNIAQYKYSHANLAQTDNHILI